LLKSEDKLKYDLIKDKEGIISLLAKTASILSTNEDMKNSAVNVSRHFTVFLPLEGIVDIKAEIKRLEKEKQALEKDFNIYNGKLSNEGYLKKAYP